MKFAISAPLAAILMAGAIEAAGSTPSCAGGSYSTTTTITNSITIRTTTTTTIRPTTKSTSTRTITAVATKTNFKMVTSTRTATSYITRMFPVTTTTTLTTTDLDNAVTITPDVVTSTVSAIAGFVPAASALTTTLAAAGIPATNTAAIGIAGIAVPLTTAPAVVRRAATGTLCSIDIFKPIATSTIIVSTTRGTPVVTVVPASTTFTSTKTLTLGGVTIINTVKTATTVVPTTRTKTAMATIIPTSTIAPVVVNYYAACLDANLLNVTNVLAALADDPLPDGGATGLVTSSNPLIAFASPHKPVTLAAGDAAQVGINSILSSAGMTIVASTADDAGACCAQCQRYTNCAGSYFSVWYGSCNLIVAPSCPDQTASAGQFFYDNNMQLNPGSGLILSNGNCGRWTYGSNVDSEDL